MKQERAWQNKKSYKLYKENWKLCHEIVDLRDGHRCVLCYCDGDLDLDHGFSRSIKTLFFDIRHLAYLCKRHHQAKSFNPGGAVGKQVDRIHQKREGKKSWDEMCDLSFKSLPEWKRLYYQEEINNQLKEQLKYYKKREE